MLFLQFIKHGFLTNQRAHRVLSIFQNLIGCNVYKGLKGPQSASAIFDAIDIIDIVW